MARTKRATSKAKTAKPTLPILDTKRMEQMLWAAACQIRGEKDAPKFKDYILPLLFLKCISDVFEDELVRLANDFGDITTARELVEHDHGLVRFYIPPDCAWDQVRKTTTGIGQRLTDVVRDIAKANPSLQGVIDAVDFNATLHGEREISDDALSHVIEELSDPRYRLGLDDVEPDFLGRAYEYLLRKFAEGQGQSAGEFYTPREVGILIAQLLQPQVGQTAYDFACGSAGLLIKLRLACPKPDDSGTDPLMLFGQELTASSYAIARMNMIIHDMSGDIRRGDTIRNPKHVDDGKLRRFDWGNAPESSADWGWVQHAYASLRETGRAAIVLDTGAVSRGSGNQGSNKEKDICKAFVDRDLIEGVVLLPDNLFYNTTAAGIILLLNCNKPATLKDKIILVNASREFQKGRPKNFLPDAGIARIAAAYHAAQTELQEADKFVRIIANVEAVANDYNLSPSRYIDAGDAAEHRDIRELLSELGQLNARAAVLDSDLAAFSRGWATSGYLIERMHPLHRWAARRRGATIIAPLTKDTVTVPNNWRLEPLARGRDLPVEDRLCGLKQR